MRFIKTHGLGNDFILFDRRDSGALHLDGATVRRLCKRKWGIGADGILVVGQGEDGARMVIYNADGSRAEMCGNGLRCVVKFLHDQGALELGRWTTVLTDAGPRRGRVLESGGNVSTVEVEVGRPAVVSEGVEVEGFEFIHVDVGNPHLVAFVPEGTNPVDLALSVGPKVEPYGGGINVGFATVTGEGTMFLAVWERGAGFTGACGTGATAAAAAARHRRLVGFDVTVTQRGGVLSLRFEPDGTALLTGPAETVFSGDVDGVVFSH